jgi:hypothetical protein
LDGDATEDKPQTSATNVGSNEKVQSASKNKKTPYNSVASTTNQQLHVNSLASPASDSTSKNGAVALNKPIDSEGRDDLPIVDSTTDSIKHAGEIDSREKSTKHDFLFTDKLGKLKEKLENGVKLNKEEIEEVKQFITGLKYSASKLLQVAEDYEKLLDGKSSV